MAPTRRTGKCFNPTEICFKSVKCLDCCFVLPIAADNKNKGQKAAQVELRTPLIHLRGVSERWKLKVVGFNNSPSIWTRKEKAIVFLCFPFETAPPGFPKGSPIQVLSRPSPAWPPGSDETGCVRSSSGRIINKFKC